MSFSIKENEKLIGNEQEGNLQKNEEDSSPKEVNGGNENNEEELNVSRHDGLYNDKMIKMEANGVKNKFSKVTEFIKKKVNNRVGCSRGQSMIPIGSGRYSIGNAAGDERTRVTKKGYTKDEIEAANARNLYKQKINSTQSTMNIEPDETNLIKGDEEGGGEKDMEKLIGRGNYEMTNIKSGEDVELKNTVYYIPDKIDGLDDFSSDHNTTFLQKCKTYFNYFGPGWIVAIAYLDPGNLCSNLNVGLIRSDDVTVEKDYTGYYLLWVMIYGHLLGFLFQAFSMKIGHITGLDLASICYKEFDRKFSTVLYILVQIAVWGAHVQAIVGTFVALNLIFGIDVRLTIFYTLFEAVVYSFLESKSTKLLENVLSFLIGILACCFFVNVFMTSINVKELVTGILYPRIPKGKEIDALALLGSIISAHIFYLHTNLTSKKKMIRSNPRQLRKYNTLGIIESGGALFLSCLTNCFIVLTFAEVDIKGDDRKEQYNLFTAYEVMKKSFGTISMYIWSFGLLSSGNNSSFMCEYATKSVFEGFLNKRVNTFFRVLVFRFFLFTLIYLFLLYDKYSIDQLTNFINVIQVLLLPLAIVPLYKFCVHKKVLGEEFVLKPFSKYFVLFIIILLIASNLILAVINVAQQNLTPWTIAMLTFFSLIYCSFLLYFFSLPIRNDYHRVTT